MILELRAIFFNHIHTKIDRKNYDRFLYEYDVLCFTSNEDFRMYRSNNHDAKDLSLHLVIDFLKRLWIVSLRLKH